MREESAFDKVGINADKRRHAQVIQQKGGRNLRRSTTRRGTTMSNFLDALVAVLAGNAIYFLLMPHMPLAMRHSLFREDFGLLIDFLICTIIFVGVKLIRR